jgi:dTDP-4-amino-4,6-dideoxygalactose transaminase
VQTPQIDPWHYEIAELGYNYRLTDIQAALGLSQLKRLDSFVNRRNVLAFRYSQLLAGNDVVLPPDAPSGFVHGRHLYPVRVKNRRAVYASMRAAGIGVQVHYVPLYRHPIYARRGFTAAQFPHTEQAYRELLSLPLYPSLLDDDQCHVVAILREVVCTPV